ncbi:MAG: RNA polymerase sigma factor [Saprospiraceae bacterium]
MSAKQQEEYMNLIQQHEGIIHKVIGLYVDLEEDRKDLYQEVLLQGWRSYKNFKGNAAFSTWLYKVALNTILTFNKKKKKKPELDRPVVIPQEASRKEDSEILYTVIKSLEEIDRMLITLHLDGYKNKEIADISGMTQNHINVKIHRIKTLIIKRFKRINNPI